MSATRPPHASRPTLTHGERRWILRDGASIVGRGEDATVRIESGGVSRHHARITMSGGRATIEDLGSKNGTFTGEPRTLERVREPRPLRDGDIVRLGRGVRLVFHERDDEPTETEASSTHQAMSADAALRLPSSRAVRERRPSSSDAPSTPNASMADAGAEAASSRAAGERVSPGGLSRSAARAPVPVREPREFASPRAAREAHPSGPADGVSGSEFRREDELWTLRFAGQIARLADAKGLRDLARLLARPGVDVHCLELADRPLEPAAADRVIDERARREIGARARELQREIEAADRAHDLGRAEQAREELDRVTEQLAGAVGLHGRSRALGGAAERARSSVTWRIRSALKRIAAVHPRLARHLQNAVRTGTFCGYHPETPVDWRL